MGDSDGFPSQTEKFLVKGVSKREKEPRVLTLPECHRLLAELEEPYRTMVALSIATGLRCSELFALKWGDFDWENSIMFVQRSIVDGLWTRSRPSIRKLGFRSIRLWLG